MICILKLKHVKDITHMIYLIDNLEVDCMISGLTLIHAYVLLFLIFFLSSVCF